MYRCYYDASYYSEQKNGIAGVVIENEQGEVIAEKQYPFQGLNASQDAEAFALEKALENIKEKKLGNVQLFGDCKSLIEGIWAGREGFERLRDKMKEARVAMSQLTWIYREYNKAHGLTQPLHIEQERPIYDVDVVYMLTEQAYRQYNAYSSKQKNKPLALIEKKCNQHIEEAKYFCIAIAEGVQAFFRYGFILFTKEHKIISIYKSEDNKNQYGICKKHTYKLEEIFQNTYQKVKNQA